MKHTTLINACLLSALTVVTMSAQFCAIETPPSNMVDASMTVGKTPAGNYFDTRASSGTGYSGDCNPYYTVDAFLPGTYNLPNVGNAITMDAGFDAWWLITEASCSSASESVAIYERTEFFGVWSKWTLVHHEYAIGHWVPAADIGGSPHCALSAPFRVTAVPLVYSQYRVMVLPKLFGAPAQAAVRWSWSY
jgi:hypothetical protein